MNKIDFVNLLGALNTKTIIEMSKLRMFNMFNTTTSMWVDDGYVFYYDAIRPEWTASERQE